MGLKPGNYTEDERTKVFDEIKLQSTDAAIYSGFLADQQRLAEHSESLGSKKYLDPEAATREPVSSAAMANWVKELRLSYPHLLSRNSHKLSCFLNSFVSSANLNKISLTQLVSAFPHFFDDTLQPIILADLERISLPKVIEGLRGHLCAATTLTQCLDKLDNFKINQSEILYSLYELRHLVSSAYPTSSELEIQNIVKAKAMPLLPAAVAAESRRLNRDYRHRFGVMDYPYDVWLSDLADIVAARGGQKSLKAVKLEEEEELTRVVHKVVARQPRPLRPHRRQQ